MLKRVVVTGMGLVSPLGAGTKEEAFKGPWEKLLKGQSGAGPVTHFDAKEMACRVAAEVPLAKDHPDDPTAFNPDEWVEP
ncbi:MAG: beta-ketoacyl synthase N-terminal-like domain-containing protein, partial [Pseudomonadota bacterium]